MLKDNDLATAAAELRKITGDTQIKFAKRIGYTAESVQRFESPGVGVGNPKALLSYARVAREKARPDLFQVFTEALFNALGPGSQDVLRIALIEHTEKPTSVDVPADQKELVRRFVSLIQSPRNDEERRLAAVLIAAIEAL